MNRYIIHIAYLCLTLFLLASCNKQEDAMPQDEGMVTLSISAAMISRSGDSNETGDANRTFDELMHTLRIIIFDEKGDKEDDRLIDFIEEEERGLFETPKPEYFIVKANEKKTIYLLANCESILQNEKISIANLDAIELKTEDGWFSGQSQEEDFLLPATAKYTISVGEESKDLGTLYLAHAANKIQFEFINNTGKTINLHSWTLSSLAPRSYLVPHVNKEKWFETLQAEEDNVIYDYNVPITTDEHQEYTYEYETPLEIPTSTAAESSEPTSTITPTDSETPIYLHESKFLDLTTEDNKDDQKYTITFHISGSNLPDSGTGGDGAGDSNDTETGESRESEPRAYTATLDNLPSLFRGTYVKVKVTINALVEGNDEEGIYAEIEDWKVLDEVKGELEPKDEEKD